MGSIILKIIVARGLDGGMPLSFELTHLPPRYFILEPKIQAHAHTHTFLYKLNLLLKLDVELHIQSPLGV